MLVKKAGIAMVCGALFIGGIASCGNAEDWSKAKAPDGKALFVKHCAVCHKDGGNIINPKKTLKSKDLKASGIKTVADIVKKMRNPGPGMTKFDKKTISEDEAKAIAKYVLSAF